MPRNAFIAALAVALVQGPHASAGAKDVTLVGRTVAYKGKSFRVPCPKEDAIAVLGPPTRVERLANDIYTWDNLGFFAYVRSGGAELFSFNIALGDMTKFLKFAPRTPFAGVATVDGARVTPKSTIEAINKEKRGMPFRPDFVRYSFRHADDGFVYFLNRGTPAGFSEGGDFIELSIEWTGKK